MFEGVSKKIKFCSYLYFLGNVMEQWYYLINQYLQLGSNAGPMFSLLIGLFNTVIAYLILGLIIYGFGCVVEYFERLNSRKDSSNLEKY